MKIATVADILNAKILVGGENLDREVRSACGSDMMSDVLAYVEDQGVLLSGLMNPQVIRTCMMMDMYCVVFVRGKTPSEDVLELANSAGIAVLATELTMFQSCGRLYEAGLGK